jgi:hypothetical protein
MKITSKQEFFALWEAGCLGNRPPLWRDPSEAYRAGHLSYGLRELGKAGGGKWEIVEREQLHLACECWKREGRQFIIDSTVPNEHSTIIGEICRTFRGLEGYLGNSRGLPMRPAIKAGYLLPRTGATILALLETYMDASSRDDISSLLDLYPDATIEFACFNCDVGIIPNRNTIIWEVRCY